MCKRKIAKRINPSERVGLLKGNQEIISFSRYLDSGRHIYNIKCRFCNHEYESSYENWKDKRRTGKSCIKCSNIQNKNYERLSASEYQISILYSNYKSRAKLKGWVFTIEKEVFKNLVTKNCHYCNMPPNKIRKDRVKSSRQEDSISFYTNGLDRIDSDKGYELNNVLTCCEDCNKDKKNLNYNQFIELIKKIYHNIYETNIKMPNRL